MKVQQYVHNVDSRDTQASAIAAIAVKTYLRAQQYVLAVVHNWLCSSRRTW